MSQKQFIIENDTLVRYIGDRQDVVIPDGIKTIAPLAFLDKEITSVMFPEGLTEIGHHAFMGCRNLKKIAFPSSLKLVHNHAFFGCEQLEEVRFDADYLRGVGKAAFDKTLFAKQTKGLIILGNWVLGISTEEKVIEELVIPEGVKCIASFAFCGYYYIPEIKKVVFPESLELIGTSAFAHQDRLTDVYFGNNLKFIANKAFYGCKNLANVHRQEDSPYRSLVVVGRNAFDRTGWETPEHGFREGLFFDRRPKEETPGDTAPLCRDEDGHSPENGKIMDMTWAHWFAIQKEYGDCEEKTEFAEDHSIRRMRIAHPQIIWENGFQEIIAAKYPDVSAYEILTNESCRSIDGVIYTGERNNLTLEVCPPGKTGVLRIPEGVRNIMATAFFQTKISGVELPDTLDFIDEVAFYACDRLTRIQLPAHVTVLGDQGLENPFVACKNLTSVDVDIKNSHYYSLDGLLYEEGGSLVCCPAGKAEPIVLPNCCKSVGVFAFAGCRTPAVTLPSDLQMIASSAFWACRELTEITLPESLTTAGEELFKDCTNLKDIYILSPEFGFDTPLGSVLDGCPKDVCIHGKAGGEIEAYVKNYGLRFKALET